jgi:protein NUD1
MLSFFFVSRRLASSDVRDVKRLYLSGNPENDFSFLTVPCYNLVYLELAGCRIETLPAVLATLVPNVRVLNLNYNFVSDASPLQGLVRLKRLTLVGSRLKGTKGILKALQKMPDMEMVDLR